MLYSANSLKNYHLTTSDGDLGHIADIYFDSKKWTVRFFLVNTGAWLLGKEILIPARALSPINTVTAAIRVNLTLDRIKQALDRENTLPVSRRDDITLHEHYGVDPSIALFSASYADLGGESALEPEHVASNQTNCSIVAERGDFHLRSVRDVTGYDIQGSDHEIGPVADFLIDDADWSIRYFLVNTAIWFDKEVVVPTASIRGVSWDKRIVYLTVPRERVKNAPKYNADSPRDKSFEEGLAKYYG
jgi:uncharacterized protein YrrD